MPRQAQELAIMQVAISHVINVNKTTTNSEIDTPAAVSMQETTSVTYGPHMSSVQDARRCSNNFWAQGHVQQGKWCQPESCTFKKSHSRKNSYTFVQAKALCMSFATLNG
ncbi:hypothetical protein VNO78_10744 [Psophocarpus tetragonolobus]|uniref:Uncharacterized protein n=1 Tax=Psophocarpus tetragonolobus TaxID=3891 RepID=A0AAN9SRY9_PSOTE